METLFEIKRGEQAERLFDDPLLKEAFAKVEEGILDSMHRSAFGDESTHHNLVIALQLLRQIKKCLRETAETGKMAKIQVENNTAGRIRAAVGF